MGVFVGVCGIVVKRRHLLRLLLMFEVAALRLFVGRVGVVRGEGLYELSLLIVGVRACEAAVGLGILIGFARVNGRDYVEFSLLMKV